MTEKVIRLQLYDGWIVTVAEYKQMKKELESRIIAQDVQLGDKILAKILLDNEWRYHEIK